MNKGDAPREDFILSGGQPSRVGISMLARWYAEYLREQEDAKEKPGVTGRPPPYRVPLDEWRLLDYKPENPQEASSERGERGLWSRELFPPGEDGESGEGTTW